MGFAKKREDDIRILEERMYFQEIKVFDFSAYVSARTEKREEYKEEAQKVFKDKKIECRDCGVSFLFSANQQKQYFTNGWKAPKRYKKCRDYRTAKFLMQPKY